MSAASNESSAAAVNTERVAERRPDSIQSMLHLENNSSLLDQQRHRGISARLANALPPRPSSDASSLSFVSGPTFTAGSITQVSIHLPTTYIPMQVPGLIDTGFTANPGYTSPLIYPSAQAPNPAYYGPGASNAPAAPPPCTLLPNAAPVTAVCHCVYAEPCALHHRPITYAPHSLNSLSTSASSSVPSSHTHNLSQTLNFPQLRSTTMRLKRPNDAYLQPSAAIVNTDGATHSRVQKIRRINPTTDSQTPPPSDVPHSHIRTFVRNEGASSANGASYCCECITRACIACSCHHHVCPRQRSCMCQRSIPSSQYRGNVYRREPEINPVHDLLLSSQMAQLDRQQQADNLWFQRQALTPSLVGVDVVTRRITPHPYFMLPRYQQPLMELSMVLLQPHEAAFVLGGGLTPSSEALPIGATLEQINHYSTMYRYVKEKNVPENELERCTVCLSEFEASEEVRSLRCAHVFHTACIDRWLLYNKKCPVCRIDLDKAEASASAS